MTAIAYNFPTNLKIFGIGIGWGNDTLTLGLDNWVAWPWSLFVQPSLEYAAGFGCNVVRLVGYPYSVYNGSISLAQSLGQWDQFIGYAKALGMKTYPCMYAIPDPSSTANCIAYTKAFIDAFHVRYLNDIIGIELSNENVNSSPANPMYTGVFGYANLPATWPLSASNSGGDNIPNTTTNVNFVNAVDQHLYPGTFGYGQSPNTNAPLDAAHMTSFQADYVGYDIMIGESGVNYSIGNAQVATWIESIVASTFNSSSRGCIFWVVCMPGYSLGFMNSSNNSETGAAPTTVRSQMSQPLLSSKFLAASLTGLLPPFVPRIAPSNAMVWDSSYSTANWATTNLYRLSGTTKTKVGSGLYAGRYDDSAYWLRQQTGYYATVVDGTSAESTQSPLCVAPGRGSPDAMAARCRLGLH